MRLLTFRDKGTTRAARVQNDVAVELPFRDVGAILSEGAIDAINDLTGPFHRVADLELAPPVLSPQKIICVGQNYRSHIREQGVEIPDYPTLFSKWASTLVGARDNIVLPGVSTQADWEVELAFYIGKHARHASVDEAEQLIAGYTILNDVSIRDWQWHTSQFLPGKNFESTTPIGPWMVTPDEIDPLNLELRCEVDGQLMQQGNTADFVFTPGEVIAYASTFTTLEPGDLFSTGTPAGVGVFRQPPAYLRATSIVTSEIEGIGQLVNRCVSET